MQIVQYPLEATYSVLNIHMKRYFKHAHCKVYKTLYTLYSVKCIVQKKKESHLTYT